MWSTPIVAMAILAIAYASPVPQTTPDSLVIETTTLLTTAKKDEAISTTSGDLHSLPTESTKVTKKHFTFKPFTFSPRTLKPFTFKTLKPLKPITPHTPITEKPLNEKVSETTLSPTTTIASLVNPARQVRSAVFRGEGWQLVETPSTFEVLPGQELTTPFSTTFDIKESTPITVPTFKPLDLTAPEKENETTTTLGFSTVFPTITAAPLLPKRLVRAAAFGPQDWQGQVTAQPEEVLLTDVPTTEIPTDLPEEESSSEAGPGWEMSDDSEIDIKDSTTTAFTDFSHSTSAFEDVETTASTFAPITTEAIIRAKRLAGFKVSWNQNGDMEAVDLSSEMPSDMETDISTEIPSMGRFSGPGWQVEESDEKVNIDGNDMTTDTTDLPSSESTMEGEDESSLEPGWAISDLESTVGIHDDTTSAFTDMPELTTLPEEEETTTVIDHSMPAIGNSFEGQPGWQIAETGSTVDIHDDGTTSAFTDMPQDFTTPEETTTVIDHSMPAIGNSFDGQPGWQIAETGSTVDINDGITTAFTDMPEDLTTLPDDETTVIDHSMPALGNSFDGSLGWELSETGSTIDISDDSTRMPHMFGGQPGWQIAETGSTVNIHDDDTTDMPEEETTVVDHM